MHMKACGNVFCCKCGIRLCSLGALKRHCRQFGHEPESLDPKPESAITGLLSDPTAASWATGADALPAPYVASLADQQQALQQQQQAAAAMAARAMTQAGGADAANALSSAYTGAIQRMAGMPPPTTTTGQMPPRS